MRSSGNYWFISSLVYWGRGLLCLSQFIENLVFPSPCLRGIKGGLPSPDSSGVSGLETPPTQGFEWTNNQL